MEALSHPGRGWQMKRYWGFAWMWVAALALVAALSFTGCQTRALWRANGLRGDAPQVSEGADGDRPCRFG